MPSRTLGPLFPVLVPVIAAFMLTACGAVIPSLDDRAAFMSPDLLMDVGK